MWHPVALHSFISQKHDATPNVYVGAIAHAGRMPRYLNMSMSVTPRLPPRECPAKQIFAKGDEEVCSSTRGRRRS